jgi:hypothetical protein
VVLLLLVFLSFCGVGSLVRRDCPSPGPDLFALVVDLVVVLRVVILVRWLRTGFVVHPRVGRELGMDGDGNGGRT